MAGGNAIKGTRVGAGPMGATARGREAPRRRVVFYCAHGHESGLSFALDAVTPDTWECVRCGQPANQDPENPPPAAKTEPFKTHLAYVKERRSESDGEALLADALTSLRQRRTL